MQQNLLRFQEKQKYILFDLETCHLNLVNKDNKPWQIGYVIGEGKNIVKTVAHMILWDPLNITDGAAKVTKFDKKKYLEEAKNPKSVYSELETYLYDKNYIILGHNILNFDVYLLNIWRQLIGLKTDYSFIERCFDTNALSKAIKLNVKPREDENLIAFQYSMLNHKQKGLKTNLTTLGTEYKLEFDPESLHDASKDTELNWKVWNKIVWEIEI